MTDGARVQSETSSSFTVDSLVIPPLIVSVEYRSVLLMSIAPVDRPAIRKRMLLHHVDE